MGRKYYPICIRLDGLDSYLVWFSNDADGVLADGEMALAFPDEATLRGFAERAPLDLEVGGPARFDLDALGRWVVAADPSGIDCPAFLNVWNLADDLARSVGREVPRRGSPLAKDVYDKLFWGCDLPAVTPSGKSYCPPWSVEELGELRGVLSECLAIARAALPSRRRGS